MTHNKKDLDRPPPTLRQRAETKVRATEAEGQTRLSPEEIQRLYQELQTHQVELEMQNEELQRAQGELEASRARYFDLYDLAPVGYVTLSREGLILEANLTAAGLLGMARGAVIKQPLERFIFPADRDRYNSYCRLLFESGAPQTSELRMVRLNDSPFWAQVQATVLQDPSGERICRTVINDITARKQTEAALHESDCRLHQAHEILEAVTQGTSVIMAAIDTDFRYTFFNRAYRDEMKRLSGQEIQLGGSMVEAFARMPEQQQAVIAEWAPALRGEKTSQTLEFGEAGSYRRVYDILHTPIRNASGHVIGAGEVAYDVTDKTLAEEALLESERRFRLALKNAPVTVATQDENLRFTWAYNQRTVRPADVIGKTDTDMFPPETAAQLMALKRQVLETGTEVHQELWVASGGHHVFVDLFLEPIRDETGQVTGIGIATVDLTAQRLADEALQARQAELTATNERLRAQQEELAAANAELVRRTAQLAQTNVQLQRLNRTLAARSNSNRAFMQTTSETGFLDKVCRIVVEDCGYAMAWIGYAEDDEAKSVRPVAYAGFEAGYLESLHITWADSERGRGPTGVAIRTGRPSACRNMLTDPQFTPWREQALKRGYAASLVLPLLAKGRAFGGLSIYFTEPDSFSDDEVALLSGLADDVATGIQTIRLRVAHARAEAALRAAHDELERRIAERTSDLQAANAQLQAEIVERQQAELQLRLQTTALEAAANGVVITDSRGNILWSNPAFTALTGYTAEEALGQTPRLVRSGQQPTSFYAQMWQTILAGQIWQGELVNRRKDGTLYTEEMTITPVRSKTGRLSHFIAIKQDVTQRKQAEDELRQSARRAHAIAEISQAAVEAKFDDRSAMEAMAERLAALFNDACLIVLFSPDSQALTVEALRYPDPAIEADLQQRLSGIWSSFEMGRIAGQVLRTGKPLLVPFVSSAPGLEWIRPDFQQAARQAGLHSLLAVPLHAQERIIGQLLLLRLRPEVPYSAEDQMTVQSLADRVALAITNAQLYRDLENALVQEQAIRQQLVQAEKLGALGRMVSSVAHELNNPLQTINNCLYLTGQELSDESPIHDYLEMANSETQRLVHLVAQLRELYRPRTAGPVPHDLAHLLRSVRSLMTPQLLSGRVHWQQPAGLPSFQVCIVSDRLKQVFINLATNAIEAMQPEGGQLLVDMAPSADGRQVGVSFRDTGPGIAPQHLSRIFEPFFTTKSQGLGLGLSICYEIAQQHGGHITAESQPGQGAVFTVWLPLAQPVGDGDTQKTIGEPNHVSF